MEKELTENEKQAQKLIVEQVNNALSALEEHFKKYCDEVSPAYNNGKKSSSVPMIYISQSIKIFKENFNKGVSGD